MNVKRENNKAKKQSRCGHCDICRNNCIKQEKDVTSFCSICVKKEAGTDLGGRGCKNREPCKEPDKKRRIQTEVEGSKKNKAVESPEGKGDSKIAKKDV